MKWNDLTMKERSDLMSLFLKHGIGSLSDMRHIYDGLQDTVDKVNRSDADFVQRLKDPDRRYIKDWADSNSIATHKLGVEYDNEGNPIIYPNVQNIDGKLVDFTRPPYHPWAGFDSAMERGDTVRVNSIKEGLNFTEHYKDYYPKGHTFSGEGDGNLNTGLKYSLSLNYIPINEPDNYVELPIENSRYLTDDNYLEEHSKFRKAFEQYYPKAYWDSKGKKWTIGTGLTYIIDKNGKKVPVKRGDKISELENQRQLELREIEAENYARTKSKYYDNYHPELKFQLLDAMFNVGNSGVWNQSPLYQKALRKYEEDRGWEDPEYNLGYIFKHADWDLNDKKWLGLRSRMRRNPQSIVPEDYEKIYFNQYRDSLRTAYDNKFNEYIK